MFEATPSPTFEDSSEMIPHLFHSGSRKRETEQSRHFAVKRAIAMMQDHYQDTLTLEMIASSVQFSPFHFNRIFRSITGVPPSVYLAALRIDQAKKMLLRTNRSVTSICFDIGYNSLGTFTTRFTQLVGTTPTQLRRISQDTSLTSFFQDWSHFKSILDIFRQSMDKGTNGTIVGKASVSEHFDGLIFIGLFHDPIPQGEPVSFTVLTEPGYYRLPSVPAGKYYLFATTVQKSDDFREMLESNSCLCCTRLPAISMSHENLHNTVDIRLDSKGWTDAPILLALPWLLISKLVNYYPALYKSMDVANSNAWPQKSIS